MRSTKVHPSFVVYFHLLTLIVLSRVLHMVSARARTCALSSLGQCTSDVVSSAPAGENERKSRSVTSLRSLRTR
jgi:hypothetical protein